ncbi:MAG: sialate O-acetylesterase [Planktothrix sp. GU0601_MAG3]|nr:MAG: sialate O-acetylesterase [Planktothrix sp. GU0601_MAG3]
MQVAGLAIGKPDYNDGNGVNQYDHFLATVKNAMAVQDIDGDGESDVLTPVGIVWMQGESDAAHTLDIAERYESHLKRIIDLFRAAFRTDDLPVVIGRISDSGQGDGGKVWKYGAVIRNAQAQFVQKDGYAALVTTTDNHKYSDPWHYQSDDYLDLGSHFAEAIVKLEP